MLQNLLFELKPCFLVLEFAHLLEHVGVLHVSFAEVDVCDVVYERIECVWVYFVIDLGQVCEVRIVGLHPLGLLLHVLHFILYDLLEVLIQYSF